MPTYSNTEYLRIIRPLPSYVERDFMDIPVIRPEKFDISDINNGKWLINLKNTKPSDRLAKSKIVHSFCYDDVLRRWYNNPLGYAKKVAPYYAVSSFDFTMDEKMDLAQIFIATYRNRWTGAFLQSHGINVIPTVGWVTPKTYEICFSGLRDGGVFIISTLGVNNIVCRENFLLGYKELRNRFPNTTLICVGDQLSDMDNDVCYVKYEDSFGNWDRYRNYYQLLLVNWDNSIPEEVLKDVV